MIADRMFPDKAGSFGQALTSATMGIPKYIKIKDSRTLKSKKTSFAQEGLLKKRSQFAAAGRRRTPNEKAGKVMKWKIPPVHWVANEDFWQMIHTHWSCVIKRQS